MLRKTIIFSILLLISACDTYTPRSLLDEATKAHNQKKFSKKKGIEVHFVLHAEHGDSVHGTMTWLSRDDLGLVHLDNGVNLTYDAEGVSSMGKSVLDTLPSHFHPELWPEILTFPFRLNSPNWKRSEYLNPTLNGERYRVKKVKVPDPLKPSAYKDRIVYADSEENLIQAIVLADRKGDLAANSAAAYAVVFSDYRELKGMVIAHRWEFKKWFPDGRLTENYGHLILRDVLFLEETENYRDRWTDRYTSK